MVSLIVVRQFSLLAFMFASPHWKVPLLLGDMMCRTTLLRLFAQVVQFFCRKLYT